MELLTHKWADVCLKDSALRDMLTLLKVTEDSQSVVWIQFVAVAAGHITQVSVLSSKYRPNEHCSQSFTWNHIPFYIIESF